MGILLELSFVSLGAQIMKFDIEFSTKNAISFTLTFLVVLTVLVSSFVKPLYH